MSDFFSLYSHEFVRIACCVPRTRVANAPFNLAETLRLAAEGDKAGTALMVFPELGLSSYAIEDLLLQDALLDEVERSVAEVVKASKKLNPVLIVGAPLRVRGRLYNTAVAIHRGVILGVVPKIYLPNYREFYEKRHFVSGANVLEPEIRLADQTVPFGTDFLFRSTGSVPFTFHVEICEDIWVPVPPSSHAALAGAEVLVNLSASNITIGKAETRRLLCGSQSSRSVAAYAYSASGAGESRPISPGTVTRPSSNAATSWPSPSASPRSRSSSRPISTSAASARSGCATMPLPTARPTRARG